MCKSFRELEEKGEEGKDSRIGPKQLFLEAIKINVCRVIISYLKMTNILGVFFLGRVAVDGGSADAGSQLSPSDWG